MKKTAMAKQKWKLIRVAPLGYVSFLAGLRGEIDSRSNGLSFAESGGCRSYYVEKRVSNIKQTHRAFDRVLYQEAKAAADKIMGMKEIYEEYAQKAQNGRPNDPEIKRAKTFEAAYSEEVRAIYGQVADFRNLIESTLKKRLIRYKKHAASYFFGVNRREPQDINVMGMVDDVFRDIRFDWSASEYLEFLDACHKRIEKQKKMMMIGEEDEKS